MSVAVAGTLRMAEWFFNPALKQGPSCRSKDLHLPSFAPIALSLHRSSTETHLTLLRVLIVVNGGPDIKISPQDIEFRVCHYRIKIPHICRSNNPQLKKVRGCVLRGTDGNEHSQLPSWQSLYAGIESTTDQRMARIHRRRDPG